MLNPRTGTSGLTIYFGLWLLGCLFVSGKETRADGEIYSTRPAADQALSIRSLPSPFLEPKDLSAYNTKIIQVFNQRQCPGTRGLLSAELYSQLGPLTLAIAAYCDPDRNQAELRFQRAEIEDPSNDSIALLHAHYASQHSTADSVELWKQVLRLTHNQRIATIAKAFLQGTGDAFPQVQVDLPILTYANLVLGPRYETNPLLQSLSYPHLSGSLGLGAALNAGIQHPWDFGSLSAQYSLVYDAYTVVPGANLVTQQLEVPFAIRAGDQEDLKVRLFGSDTALGPSQYSLLGGLGVEGVAYHSNTRQTVQGSVFADHYFDPNLRGQAGSHFRFDYRWEFFQQASYANIALWVEHVAAGRKVNSVDLSRLNFSHTDLGTEIYLERQFRRIMVGLYVKTYLREDRNDSSYYSSTQTLITKRRQDLNLSLGPNLIFSLGATAQLIAAYRFNRNYSNFAGRDYFDATYADHTVQIAFRKFWGNF